MLYFLLFLLGVSTSYWEERDFSECEFRGLGISRDGVVILSHGVDSLLETSDMYLWDILYTCGALYVASGDDGRVYRIKEGDGELFFDSGEENVLTLAEHNSYIYAGTSPGGKVYKIDEEGRGEELFDSDEEFIWDLVIKPDGRIIFGTGGNGLVIALGDDRVDTLLYTGRSNASLLK